MSQAGLWTLVPHLMWHQRRIFFSSYTAGDFGTLTMGNETVSRVVGIGTISLETSVGTKLVLNNVKHAPDGRLHLISVGV